ncbi:hypothetical protein CY34DRAFT_243313 [Suillus luteus UH-Slu-Lm8-n1]|uniref:Coatomer subunit epsilon n=1 Tax=Suillus luteus UH-Slu-Lm8-n1 TaxID=930992 RepID=A0A0D0BBA1_9AGAM|nr:hypothetical protein CY34DRAFT_243313 [Suillus luteus UH-Slu-Lm8-n1]
MQIWTLTTLPKDAPKEPLKITIPTAVRDALINGDLSTADTLLTQEISTDTNNHNSYANRSLVMARKNDWDHALDDAIKSVTIQPSLMGYIFKGIALCGKGYVRDARIAFDLAFMFTNKDLKTIHFLLLVKAIALFNSDQHEEAMLFVQQLAAACPNDDTLACHVVETYFNIQLGITALNDAHHDEAVGHFTAATCSSALSSAGAIDSMYKDFVVAS